MTREPYKLEPDEERRLELQRDRTQAAAAVVRWAAIIVIVTAATLAWLFRWDVTPTTGGGGFPTAIVLDRLTGSLFYIQQNHSLRIIPGP
jgi:fatty acid desaturase